MSTHFLKELGNLREHLLTLSARVEQAVADAIRSVQERNAPLARQVIVQDVEVDRSEVDIEQECLRTLALHQPVAADLRLVFVVTKIIHDLERIGDLARHIAAHAVRLAAAPEAPFPPQFPAMASAAQKMLKQSIDAFVSQDSSVAYAVLAADDAVDDLYHEAFDWCVQALQERPENPDLIIQCLAAARHLERTADHATNIAEDVIYLLDGEIVRHRRLPAVPSPL